MKIRKILYPLIGGLLGILAGPGGVVIGIVIGFLLEKTLKT